jgi:hypothetical protein
MDAVNEIEKRPYQRWPAGVSGNPHGRPAGARGQLSEEILRTLRRVFMIEGEAAMIRTAKENPSAFTAICARLLPTEASITLDRVTPQGLDASDLSILKAIKQAIPDANSRSPEDVLTYVLEAVRAHGSHQIIDASQDT